MKVLEKVVNVEINYDLIMEGGYHAAYHTLLTLFF